MVRQPFSYYGGKQKMVRHILPIVDSIPHTVYGEPFCGGASVLFAREARAVGNSDHYREYINDINEWVTTFYRVGKLQPEQLYRLIDATLYSEADHRRAKDILKSPEEHSDLDVAWAFYVQANMSFSRRIFTGWGSGVTSENGPSTWNRRKATLADALARLSEVAISSADALDAIKRWDSPQTLHYVDSPYPKTEQGHYSGYTLADFQALCDCLDNIQGSYILSCYPQEIEPQSAQRKVEIETKCSASGKGKTRADKSRAATQAELGDRKRTEVLWVCDRSANMRPELVPIAAKHVVGSSGAQQQSPMPPRVAQLSLLDLAS